MNVELSELNSLVPVLGVVNTSCFEPRDWLSNTSELITSCVVPPVSTRVCLSRWFSNSWWLSNSSLLFNSWLSRWLEVWGRMTSYSWAGLFSITAVWMGLLLLGTFTMVLAASSEEAGVCLMSLSPGKKTRKHNCKTHNRNEGIDHPK